MKRIFALITTIILILLAILSGCNKDVKQPIFSDELKLIGDIANVVTLNSYEGYETQKTTIDTDIYDSIAFSSIVAKVNPYDNKGSVLIASKDGIAVKISINDIEGLRLLYNDKDKWRIYGEGYPAPVGIKDIDTICFISERVTENIGAIIRQKKDYILSIGNILLKDYEALGEPVSLNEHKAQKYQKKQSPDKVYLSDYVADFTDYDKLQIYFKDRSIVRNVEKTEGYFTIDNCKINFINSVTTYNDILGISLDCDYVITDAYSDFKKSLDNGKKTMIIELDGFSYEQYLRNRNSLTAIGMPSPVMMLSVMPSISNVGLSAIITGKTPYETGITERKARNLTQETIFHYAKKLNKTVAYIEGNSTLLNISDIDTILNVDNNGDGLIDDDIFDTAIKNINKDLIYVHFHSIDDYNHKYNPYSNEANAQINKIKSYLESLLEFDGNIYIISDHGAYAAYEYENGEAKLVGNHGLFNRESMYIPYFRIER